MTGRRSWVEQVMGLPVSVLVRGDDPDAATAAVHQVYEELRWVDAVFSPYQESSQVTRVAAGRLALVDAHPLVQDVAARCEQWRARTGGVFDPTRPDGRWDPSGLVKGWAAERAAEHLRGLGQDWLLNAGGDVVLSAPSGEPFRVGIEDPLDRTGVLAVVALTDGAVATSGTAHRGSHLYDPRSGASVEELASVSVTGPSLEVADVLATVGFVAGTLDDLPPGYDGLLVHRDRRRVTTAGWPTA